MDGKNVESDSKEGCIKLVKVAVIVTDKILFVAFAVTYAYVLLNEEVQPKDYRAFLILWSGLFAALWFLVELHGLVLHLLPGRFLARQEGMQPLTSIYKCVPFIIFLIPNFMLRGDNIYILILNLVAAKVAVGNLVHFLVVDLSSLGTSSERKTGRGERKVKAEREKRRKKKTSEENLRLLERHVTSNDDDDDDDDDDP